MSDLHTELKTAGRQRQRDQLNAKTETLRYTVKGLALLLEATALGITSAYAIYSGWTDAKLPTWGADVLMVAGVCIALRAFVEFVKFLNRR